MVSSFQGFRRFIKCAASMARVWLGARAKFMIREAASIYLWVGQIE